MTIIQSSESKIQNPNLGSKPMLNSNLKSKIWTILEGTGQHRKSDAKLLDG